MQAVRNNFFFIDVCRECGHVIAVHQYTFSVDEDYQVQLHNVIIIQGGGGSPWSLLVSYATALHYLLYLTLPCS